MFRGLHDRDFTGLMWISSDGQFKVEVISHIVYEPIVNRDVVYRRYDIQRWLNDDNKWGKVVTTNNIRIVEKFVNVAELIEYPNPEWETSAFHSNS